jgi:hypothetical protein
VEVELSAGLGSSALHPQQKSENNAINVYIFFMLQVSRNLSEFLTKANCKKAGSQDGARPRITPKWQGGAVTRCEVRRGRDERNIFEIIQAYAAFISSNSFVPGGTWNGCG